MQEITGLSFEEATKACMGLGFPLFKAREIFRGVHRQHKQDFDSFTTLSKEERERLGKHFYLAELSPAKEQKGREVKKVSFKLEDGKLIEAVLMKARGEKNTVCVSSQVGCPVRCLFCSTGKMGFKRNLTAGEILGQVYHFARQHEISNVVFMGMGEPLLNYDDVMVAARTLNHSLGMGIAARKIVISTVGIIEGIRKLAREKEQFRLAWSLISPFDDVRKRLIALRSLPSIGETIDAINDYQRRTKRRVTIEYVVIDGVNDRYRDTDALIDTAKALNSHVNLIPYNPAFGADYKEGNVSALYNALQNKGVLTTIRKSLGAEINAACGQLVGR